MIQKFITVGWRILKRTDQWIGEIRLKSSYKNRSARRSIPLLRLCWGCDERFSPCNRQKWKLVRSTDEKVLFREVLWRRLPTMTASPCLRLIVFHRKIVFNGSWLWDFFRKTSVFGGIRTIAARDELRNVASTLSGYVQLLLRNRGFLFFFLWLVIFLKKVRLPLI